MHAGQRAPRKEITKRTLEAMRHPAVRSLCHPTGRIINHRPENALDLEQVFEVALETGVALEVNGLPPRLDLRDEHVRRRSKPAVPIVCNDRRPLRARSRDTCPRPCHSQPGLADGGGRPEHEPAV